MPCFVKDKRRQRAYCMEDKATSPGDDTFVHNWSNPIMPSPSLSLTCEKDWVISSFSCTILDQTMKVFIAQMRVLLVYYYYFYTNEKEFQRNRHTFKRVRVNQPLLDYGLALFIDPFFPTKEPFSTIFSCNVFRCFKLC